MDGTSRQCAHREETRSPHEFYLLLRTFVFPWFYFLVAANDRPDTSMVSPLSQLSKRHGCSISGPRRASQDCSQPQ